MRIVKKGLLLILGLAPLGLIGFWAFAPAMVEKGKNTVKLHEPYPVSAEAAALHETLVIADWHADSLLWNRNLLERGDYATSISPIGRGQRRHSGIHHRHQKPRWPELRRKLRRRTGQHNPSILRATLADANMEQPDRARTLPV